MVTLRPSAGTLASGCFAVFATVGLAGFLPGLFRVRLLGRLDLFAKSWSVKQAELLLGVLAGYVHGNAMAQFKVALALLVAAETLF